MTSHIQNKYKQDIRTNTLNWKEGQLKKAIRYKLKYNNELWFLTKKESK